MRSALAGLRVYGPLDVHSLTGRVRDLRISVRTMAALQRRGHVARTGSPEDGGWQPWRITAAGRRALLTAIALVLLAVAPAGAQRSQEFKVDTAIARRTVIVCITSADRPGPPVTCVPKDPAARDFMLNVTKSIPAGAYHLVLFDRDGRLLMSRRFRTSGRTALPKVTA